MSLYRSYNSRRVFHGHIFSFADMIKKIDWLRDQDWTAGSFEEQADHLPGDDSVDLYTLESADLHWPTICDRARVEYDDLPLENVSTSPDVFEWTPKLLAQVAQIYPNDLKLWNYLRTIETE